MRKKRKKRSYCFKTKLCTFDQKSDLSQVLELSKSHTPHCLYSQLWSLKKSYPPAFPKPGLFFFFHALCIKRNNLPKLWKLLHYSFKIHLLIFVPVNFSSPPTMLNGHWIFFFFFYFWLIPSACHVPLKVQKVSQSCNGSLQVWNTRELWEMNMLASVFYSVL